MLPFLPQAAADPAAGDDAERPEVEDPVEHPAAGDYAERPKVKHPVKHPAAGDDAEQPKVEDPVDHTVAGNGAERPTIDIHSELLELASHVAKRKPLPGCDPGHPGPEEAVEVII